MKDLISRIWKKDASVWKNDAGVHAEIRSRLGWLDAPFAAKKFLPEIISFADEIKKSGFKTVVLLGMGGSSLCPEVFQKTFGNRKGFPELLVCDSTDPDRVRDIEKKINIRKTLFIVSSKSGGTIELVSLFKYFSEKAPPSQFVAITDPGTSLVDLAKTRGFRRVFLADPNVGGRFSALTYFGLVPAALIGVDVGKVVDSAIKMAKQCRTQRHDSKNPAAVLGEGMARWAKDGRDKLTIVTPKGLESFGDWAEQLVAESTGKEGKGVIPVVGETLALPSFYGPDRFFVTLESKSKPAASFQKKLNALETKKHPALRLRLNALTDLGAEFFRWEMATAVACALLKINAFDQPDVQAAKDSTKAILKELNSGTEPIFRKSEGPISTLLSSIKEGDYVGILAFLPDRPDLRKKLTQLQKRIALKTKKAVTLGIGPRYLHSTGQLHKGGPNIGRFLLITADGAQDLEIPDAAYTFGQLEMAQAAGDYQALRDKGRLVMHVRLPNRSAGAFEKAFQKI